MIKLTDILNENNQNEDLIKLEKLMKAHDWYFERSDDQRVWKRGSAERKVIDDLIKKINKNGYGNDTSKLLKKYKPKMMGSVTRITVPAPKRPKK